MKKKKVLIISNFMKMPSENSNEKYMYIAKMLKDKYDVSMIASTFYHSKKTQRVKTESEDGIEIKQVFEPGYKRNVSLKRMYSNYRFGKNVGKYLKTIEKPDYIICAIPSLTVGKVSAKYAKKHNIKFLIDLQDLWPETFETVFKVPVIKGILFYPLKKIADYIYKSANAAMAVSDTYANRIRRVNKDVKIETIFLGTKLTDFDKYASEIKIEKENKDEIKLVYIGTIGHSYNLKLAIDATKELSKKYKVKLVVMGDGPLRKQNEEYAKKIDSPCEFMGMLQYEDMVKELVQCDIALNPIMKGSAISIINKVGDYAAAGLPVVNTHKCNEYINLLEEYNAGINSEDELESFVCGIEKLMLDEKLRNEMGKNNRRLAIEKFDRDETYKKILDLL